MKWLILVVDESTGLYERLRQLGDRSEPSLLASQTPFRVPELVCERVDDGKTGFRRMVRGYETEKPYNLIVIARDLPGDWDGAETLYRIRQYRHDTACVLVVDHPESLDQDALKKAWESGPFHLLRYPCSSISLALHITHYFHRYTGRYAGKATKKDDAETEKRLARFQELLSRSQEEQRKLVEKLSALQLAYERKSEYLTVMSHEIRTPLNSILGVVEILQYSGLDVKQQDLINALTESGDTLLSLINDILDMAKIEAGKMTLDLMPFDLQQCLDSIVLMMGERAEKTHNQLVLEIASDIPGELVGDRDKLRQILINLIGNALKYTHDGTITVAVSLMKKEATELILNFRVSDTGQGIPTEKLDSLFKPFHQLKDGGSNVTGTGLGLAVCRRLVEMMHGTIGVESRPGEGSVFQFSASFAIFEGQSEDAFDENLFLSEQAASTESAQHSDADLQKTILLVEDNPTNRKVAGIHLGQAGYRVMTATNGRESLDLLKQHAQEIDLVLMDIQMPIMDGFEATEYIRNDLVLNMPIIAMTANVFGEHRSRCFEVGMDDFIPKPIRKKSFLNTMTKWLGQDLTPPLQLAQTTTMTLEPEPEEEKKAKDNPLDYAQAVREFEGDQELVREVVREFLMNTEKKMPVMGKYLFEQDFKGIEDHAHALKGGGGNLCAEPFAEAARILEEAASSGDSQKTLYAFMNLERAFGMLKEFVRVHSRLQV